MLADSNDDGSARHHVLGFALDLHTSVTGSCDADPVYIADAAARLKVTVAKWRPSDSAFDAAVRTLVEVALREHDAGNVEPAWEHSRRVARRRMTRPRDRWTDEPAIKPK